MFKAVDVDGSGTIEEEEWIDFWREVKRAGHTESEIEEEVRKLILLYFFFFFLMAIFKKIFFFLDFKFGRRIFLGLFR